MPLLFASELIVGKYYSCSMNGKTYYSFLLLQEPVKTKNDIIYGNAYMFKVLHKGKLEEFLFKLNDTFVEI